MKSAKAASKGFCRTRESVPVQEERYLFKLKKGPENGKKLL